jgi:anti-sigma28 factor (negative regulator of flagellin synthesis)
MSANIDINGISNLPPIAPTAPNLTIPTRQETPVAESDTVELSRFGRALARAAEQSSLSVARVRAIRLEIENGIFETPERINGTVNRLLDVLI